MVTGALHQYHTALILLSETYATDVRYNEDRVWKCLDFVFECPAHLARKEKARKILTEIVQKTEMYSSLRRIRAPADLEEKVMRSPPKSDYQAMRRHIVNEVATSPRLPTPQLERMGVGRNSMDAESRVWPATIAEQVQSAPIPSIPRNVPESSVSPRTSTSEGTADIVRGRGSFGSSTSLGDPMVDVDWVSTHTLSFRD
jgi:hypothetical protein